jgi:tetratricopeptide (TPR) repeat protein
MADNKEEPIVDVQGALTRSESFLEENKRSILTILAAIVGLVVIWFGYRELIYKPDVQVAEEEMLYAEKYFALDSIDKAMNGDGVNKGFIDIADEYSNTPSGNLAKYYLGVCYFQKGQYQETIDNLKDFDPKGLLVGPVANSLLGDAYMELGETETAVEYYLRSANMDRNDLTTPFVLFKAGKAYEELGKYNEAIGVYEQIRTEFPDSEEGKNIDKYLAYAKTMAGVQ